MESLIAVLVVGGLALGIYSYAQSLSKRRRMMEACRAAEEALADRADFKATARLLKLRKQGSQAAPYGIAIDAYREKLTIVTAQPSTLDRYFLGHITREELDEAIDQSILRESVRAFLRRKLRGIEEPSAADLDLLRRSIERHGWASGLLDRPLRSAVLEQADLVESEVIAYGKSIAKAARNGKSDKGAEAIIQRVAARNLAKQSYPGIYLKILINDLDDPVFLLDLNDDSLAPALSDEELLREALQWHEILRVIICQDRRVAPTEGVEPARIERPEPEEQIPLAESPPLLRKRAGGRGRR